MTSRSGRSTVLLALLVFVTAVLVTSWFEVQARHQEQARTEDLAVLASHYLWDLDQELATESGQIIVDSKGYRRLQIVDLDGSRFVDLHSEHMERPQGLLERTGLEPRVTHIAPLFHLNKKGQRQAIGTLIITRVDRAIFIYVQLSAVLLLVGLAARTLIERRRLQDATQRAQLAEEKATRLEAERRAEQREDQLLEKRQLEALGRLAAGVAHDFNNVLTVIITTAEMIVDPDPRATRGPSHEVLGQNILDAAERAANLTQQLLAFGRRQVRAPRALDLNEVVRDFQPILERAVGKRTSLQLELSEPLGTIEADPSQIEQVLLNLVVNAANAMPEGGRITIETCDLDGPAAVFGGAPIPEGKWVALAVHDTGQGMDPDTLKRAFEPFFTTREQDKGTGLGLATVYGITHQSGGEVTAASQQGVGSTLTVALPRIAGAADALRPSLPSIPPGELTVGATVMLVEDRQQVREVTAAALRSYGMQVIEAEDGLMALDMARSLPASLAALITDLQMPGITGVELAARMRVNHPDLKVLYVSGDPAGILPPDFVPNARTAVLHKPFGGARLTHAVVSLLAPRAAPAP